jgi:hypothetical protein
MIIGQVISSRQLKNYFIPMFCFRTYSILAGKTESERPRDRWEGNIRMDLRKILRESVDRMHLNQDR